MNDWDPARLHKAAWPIAQAGVDRKIEKALELWENSYGRGKVESDLASIGRLAVAGRIRMLLGEKGRNIWGRFYPVTGNLEVIQEGGADPGGDSVDLVDEIAEIVLQQGGRALALAPEKMPTDTGIAVVLR